MSLAELSIKRPVFISSIITIMLIVGYISLNKMPVNLFPDTEFPIVNVYTSYSGAAPAEIETQISKIIEDEISTIPNLKSVKSISREGISNVIAEFELSADIKEAKRNVSDKIDYILNKLPKDAKKPIVMTVDPSSNSIVSLSLTGDLTTDELYELADANLKNPLEQVGGVGKVEVWGGRDKEVLVNIDRKKLHQHNLSASGVLKQIGLAGDNIPLGKYSSHGKEIIYRTMGEYNSIDDLKNTVVNFYGNDHPVTVADIAEVKFDFAEQKFKSYVDGKPTVFIQIYRQSGSNIVSVVDSIDAKLPELNELLAKINPSLNLVSVRNDAKLIKANISDVKETIYIGIILTILVVYFFLGSIRSTFITGLALPNSLLGAFILMYISGFSINIMSLLALSLAVGLLIDDAIVVRENIFRHIQNGVNPATASIHGTQEVTLAVIGTSLTILAVFGPVAFLYGVVGQFFKEFGLTICFAMIISLFDALTIAPMMSTYFSGTVKTKIEIKQDAEKNKSSRLSSFLHSMIILQDKLEEKYLKLLKYSLKKPLLVLGSSLLIFFASLYSVSFLSKTFLPAQEHGEFMMSLELPAGETLEATDKLVQEVTTMVQKDVPEVEKIISWLGYPSNEAHFYITLVSDHNRSKSTSQVKDIIRDKLAPFAFANPLVTDVDMVGANLRPFTLTISGKDTKQLDEITQKVFEALEHHPSLSDVEISNGKGKPEVQIQLDNVKSDQLGISTLIMGQELRTQIDGSTGSLLRLEGDEYDIRVRVKEDQRDLVDNFEEIYIPNMNQTLLKLSSFATLVKTTGPVSINRNNKAKYNKIAADIDPKGPGLSQVISDIDKLFKTEIILPPGITYDYLGQSEQFGELISNMIIAMSLGLVFIYLVLASLYESYILPFTIMLVIPLALIGAFFALLITDTSLDLFSMIGCILLLGLATKNSILLVDYANQKMHQGYDRYTAIMEAGKTRLRPIIMTTVALIAGMVPVAIGINEASKQRTGMGIAIIGGLISSTILTLVVIPTAFIYIDRMRMWGRNLLKLDTIKKNF